MKRFFSDLKPAPEKTTGFFLLLLGLGLAALAQLTLLRASDEGTYWNVARWLENPAKNASPLLGLILYALAGGALLAGLPSFKELFGAADPFPLAGQPAPNRPVRFGFWLTSLGLALLTALYVAQPARSQENGYGLAFLWLLSLFLFCLTVALASGWQFPHGRQILAWVQANRGEILLVSLIVTGAFLIRFWEVELHPYAFVNDEGEIGKVGQCFLTGACQNPFAIAWASQPALAFTPVAVSIALFGNTALAVRMVSLLTGTLAVLFTYLFARETFGKKTAWVAAVLLACLPYHVHFSRLGVDNIIDSLSAPALLWLIFRAARKGTPGGYLAAGIAAGLCMYTYPGTRLTPLLGLGAFGFILLRQPGFLRAQWKNLALCLLAACLTAAPINAVFYAAPSQFFARFNGEGLLQSGALQNEMRATGASAAAILTRQFLKSSLVFIATGGPSQFFNTPRAYYSAIGALFLMLGLFITARRSKDPRSLTLFLWFFAAILLGSTLTGGPPSNQRMLSSSSASAVLAAVGLVTCLEALALSSPSLRRAAPVLLAAVLLLNSQQDLTYYFRDYRAGNYFGDLSNEITFESRVYITPLGRTGNFYLIGAPMTMTVFGNFGYFSPEVTKADFNEVTREALAALPKDKDALFLAVPAREADLLKIETWIPGGREISEQRRAYPDQPLFSAYQITRAQLQAFQP
jgi:hypothetical protein